MAQSPLARQVREKLRKLEGLPAAQQAEQKAELHGWFTRFEKRLEPHEAADVRAALGLSQSLSDVPFRELVPPGWFADLLKIQEESESPAPFFFLAGLTVFSNLVGRTLLIDRGNHRLGLDISALLISPAGRGRRSTACDFVVYEIGEAAGLTTIADSFTYEAFGDSLVTSSPNGLDKDTRQCKFPRALAYAGEMSVLLGKGSYADSIIPKLTDIIGKTTKFSWTTVKRGGKVEFVNPMVNALFTSAPDWLVDNIPAVVFGGGMLSRFLICVRDQPEQVVTWGKPIDEDQKRRLVNQLKVLTRPAGLFPRPDGSAFKWYDEWYQDHAARTLRDEIPDERMAPYYSRKHDHLLRVAALLTLAASAPMVYTVERFEQALRILDWLEVDIPKVYSQMALSPVAAAQQAVCRALTRAGGMMDHSRLQKRVWRVCPLKEHFNAVIESLVEMGVLRVHKNIGMKGRSYHLVKNLE